VRVQEKTSEQTGRLQVKGERLSRMLLRKGNHENQLSGNLLGTEMRGIQRGKGEKPDSNSSSPKSEHEPFPQWTHTVLRKQFDEKW